MSHIRDWNYLLAEAGWIRAGHAADSLAKPPGPGQLWIGDKLLSFTNRDPGEIGVVRVEQLVGLSRNYGNGYGQR